MDWKKAIRELYFCIKLTHREVERMNKKAYSVPERIVLIFVQNGNLQFFINGNEKELSSDQIFFLRPHEEVQIEGLSEAATLSIIAFTPALPDAALKQFGPAFFEYVRTRQKWQLDGSTSHALNAFYDLYEFNCNQQAGIFSAEIANSLFTIFLQTFYQLVRLQVKEVEKESQSLSSRTLATKFFNLLSENYKKEHTVNFYASRLCISSKYLTQVVKSVSNYTPKDLIDRRLGMESIFLLTKTSRNIQEISIDLGFPDQSYFGRFFKRLFGMSPLNYRQKPDMSLLEKLNIKR